jgi:serine/threonine protein phosphatase PrpC
MKIKLLLSSLFIVAAPLSAHVMLNYGMSTHQNKRPYQEDRFTHALVYGNDFFAVYDGHGGDTTSSFLQNNLHKYFAEYRSDKSSIQTSFNIAFAKAEKYALGHLDDGSTAVVGFIDRYNQLHCAWVGDSRLVLEKNGGVGFATDDHKPDREDEKKRIVDAGGSVEHYGVWRVNGLAVSRSIGDKGCKKMGQGQIVAVPEYAKMQLSRDNHFMIIASDGLWDVMSNEDAVNLVKEEFKDIKVKNTTALASVAQFLQNEAIKRGSGDNITVCIVHFDWSWRDAVNQVIITITDKFLNWYMIRK